jgi:hypothetical protein
MMDMLWYANELVGVPGESLNVEQRKRLSIAVEVVAKPELLLFLGMLHPFSFGKPLVRVKSLTAN